jgi:predicted O-linked N-acetylglucosamine transferase (SPINDLY family)
MVKIGYPKNALAQDSVEDLLTRAITNHRAGRFVEARDLYHRALQQRPRDFDCLHLLGVIEAQRGNYAEAVRQIDAALSVEPRSTTALFNRGAALRGLKQFDAALESYDRLLMLEPNNSEAHNQRGQVSARLGRLVEALSSYDKSIAFAPSCADYYCNRGNILRRLARFNEALASYDKAIELKPNYAEAYNNRGVALSELQLFPDALTNFQRAIAIKPNYATAINNKGNVLQDMMQFDESINCYEQAIALNPDYAEAHNNRGNALTKLKQYDRAICAFSRAIALRTHYAEAYNNRGVALYELKRLNEAKANYDKAIELNPGLAGAFLNRGSVLRQMRLFDASAKSYERAFALNPSLKYIKGDLLSIYMHLCKWDRFEERYSEVFGAILSGDQAANPFSILAAPSSPMVQRKCAEEYVAKEFRTLSPPLWGGERYAHDRIKVAYLSSDFHVHATAFLIAGLLEEHDRNLFEIFAISFGPDEASEMRCRLQWAVDHFIDAQFQSDESIAELIHALEIDIAVDLKGFTKDARAGILARRPSPIQVNYLGYPGTMGAEFIDYIVADSFVVPSSQQEHFSEKIVYLPGSYQANDAKRRIADRLPMRAEVGLPEGAFVFCCFNNNYKITPDLFDIWMRLLNEIDQSVLWLFEGNQSSPGNLRREAAARGIDGDRLIFAKYLSSEDHLARHKLADLFLDTLYCNAHTTASDALWAGLPIVTCAGKTFASRVAGSLLTSIGLPELIAYSPQEYEMLALRLARDPNYLTFIKHKLACNRQQMPLFNASRFAKQIESAYQTMWECYRKGQPPKGFTVDSVS